MRHVLDADLVGGSSAGCRLTEIGDMQRSQCWFPALREQAGLVGLSVTRQRSLRTVVRLYSFQDLLELPIASGLSHRPGITRSRVPAPGCL